jgi:hypothetical protein
MSIQTSLNNLFGVNADEQSKIKTGTGEISLHNTNFLAFVTN